MAKITLSRSFFPYKLNLSSLECDVSSYDLEFVNGEMLIYRSKSLLARTDGRKFLKFPLDKSWNIEIKYSDDDIRLDRVISDENAIFFDIRRRWNLEPPFSDEYNLKASLFADYTKIKDSESGLDIVIDYKQWRLFSPIKLDAYFDEKVSLDHIIINLAFAWLRYEYESHDEMW